MRDALKVPIVRVELTFPDGELVRREWSLDDDPPDARSLIVLVEDPVRVWEHPQDPVTLRGKVGPGCEVQARELLSTGREVVDGG